MKQPVYLRAVLIVAGIIGFSVGVGQLFFPVPFEASVGINLAGNINLLSEIRAAGGALLAASIFILAGAFKPSLTHLSLILAMLFYLSYSISRVYSMAVDGTPNQSFIMVTALEILVGLVAAALYYRISDLQPRRAS